MSLLSTVAAHPLIAALVSVLALSLLAFVVTTIVTLVFRVRTGNMFPEGATLIVGLGVVAVYLNTRLTLIQFISSRGEVVSPSEALLNISVFVAAGVASYGGRRLGDAMGSSDRFTWKRLQPDLSPIVRATGRFITVTVPETVEDIEGYDPVDAETKRVIAGKSMDFPKGLTIEELHSQVIARLKEEHDIGYVDVDIGPDGAVTYLAVGQRAAGLGQTIPPNSVGVAVPTDPPFSASPGDTVQLWRTDGDETETRLGTAELRASVGSVATLVIDEATAAEVDPTADHRLMTLSANSHPEREFAAMLRRKDETMSILEIATESPLIGESLGSLDVTVIAVRSADGETETIPDHHYRIEAGDDLFVLGSPEALRKLESLEQVWLSSPDEEFDPQIFESNRPEDADSGDGQPQERTLK
ncbi:cation:proton antiporter regulatory subunit [Natrinema versiforme]|uniref:Potassium transporter TrkA n=1 Tax=Natrinema versiforme TaxID=88724 RepID=A0A4P8WR65_9EURY|nr:TrkA C-terminal domain-containing protein [Natrinema versiforme]QCS44631.1 potassium transporter TrkA [Natrinema versiforme]